MLEQRLRQGQPLGHYRLLRLLGQGGFAEVYLGEHIHLNTQVAVKVLHTRLAAEDVFAVKREAQTLARLLHPNIVRVLDFGVEEETPYLVMDYAPNGTLRHALAQGSRVALSTVIAFTRQVAEALQYAHDQRLIHRDIKPENMLLGRTHEVLLSDFGIALVLQSSRSYRAENIAGTIAYMAPEQIQARPCPASDQYALGIVVYEWLCGTRPFQGSYTEIAVKQSMLPAPPLRIFAPQITPAVEQVVLQALNKDPQQRFTSVRAFALALEQAARQSATQAYPTLLPPARAAAPAALSPFASVLTPPQTTQQPRSGGKIVFDPSDRQQQRPRTSRRGFMLAGAVGLLALGACAADVTLNRLSRDKLPLLGQVVQQGGGVLHSTPPQPILSKPHAALVWIVRWSTDGAYIASGSFDGTMLVWSADTGATRLSVRSSVQPAQSDDYPWSITWSSRSDQRLAVSFVDGTIQVLDASSRERSASLNAPPAGAVALAWSPDDTRIVTANYDRLAQIWRVA